MSIPLMNSIKSAATRTQSEISFHADALKEEIVLKALTRSLCHDSHTHWSCFPPPRNSVCIPDRLQISRVVVMRGMPVTAAMELVNVVRSRYAEADPKVWPALIVVGDRWNLERDEAIRSDGAAAKRVRFVLGIDDVTVLAENHDWLIRWIVDLNREMLIDFAQAVVEWIDDDLTQMLALDWLCVGDRLHKLNLVFSAACKSNDCAQDKRGDH